MSAAAPPPGFDPRSTFGPGEPANVGADEGGETLRSAVMGKAGGWLVGGGAVALGLVTFLWLSSHRPLVTTNEVPPPSQAADAAMVAATPPPREVDAMEAAARGAHPLEPSPAAASIAPLLPAPVPPFSAAPLQPPTPPADRAAVMAVDLAATLPEKVATDTKSIQVSGIKSAAKGDEQFAVQVVTGPEPDRASATMLRNQSTLAPQGTIIPAVLETALNSDLPGFARAVVSRDVRSFDGSNVLIPRGSRVIGEYRSAVSLGQSRIFVIWTRVLRPDGGSIQIGSGGGDTLGRAGLAGKVDRHFFERFSGAVLLTVLNAAAYAAAGTPSTQVTIGSTAGSGGATSGLLPTDIPPTIKVAQGTPIRIFVQRDLDFTPVDGR